jgi:hypothetical protein
MGEIYSTLTPAVAPSVARLVVPQNPESSPDRGRSLGMDEIRAFLDAARDHGLVAGHFRGLLHIAIGRKITKVDGTVVSAGLTWRELAGWLKQLRFDRELVRELGADPDELAPRDRERFWYSAIAAAKVDSPEAVADAEALTGRLKAIGYVVGPAPGGVSPAPAKAKPAEPKAKPAEPPPKRKKK